jgi:acyl-CoA synthetase (AMP-forming)/AMP-acid ligase II
MSQPGRAPACPPLARPADFVAWHAGLAPDAPATWFGGRIQGYAELNAALDAFARALVALGLQPGDRIAVLSTARPEFLVSWLGALRVGVVWLGLNPRYTYRELAHVVGDAQPRVLLSLERFEHQQFEPLVARLAREHPCIERTFRLDEGDGLGVLEPLTALLEPGHLIDHGRLRARMDAVRGRDPAVIVYTSGSSGTPKGAVIPHDALSYGGSNSAITLGIGEVSIACALPINHVGCLGDVCMQVLASGGMLAFMERFDAAVMLGLVETLHLNVLAHAPTVLQLLTQHPDWRARDLGSLRAVTWGGAAMPIDMIREFRRRGLRMFGMYGQTESVSNIAWTDDAYSDEDIATTVGRPNPDMKVKLVDAELREVADGDEGEVIVQHPAQMLGYHNLPDATAAAFTVDGFLRTGDVAVRTPSGALKLVGRRSEMFKSGGYNVYPREIEIRLEAHPAVAAAAVVGVPDPLYSEVGIAFLLVEPGATWPGEQALRDWCREQLANYKVPKTFEMRDHLPLLPVGKVDKQRLRREWVAARPPAAPGES